MESASNAFTSGVNLKMDEGSEMIFPSITYIYGYGVQLRDAAEARALDLNGRLTGVTVFIITRGCTLFTGNSFHNAMISDYNTMTYQFITSAGSVQFGEINVQSKSIYKVDENAPLTVTVGEMNLRFEAVLSASSVNLVVAELNVEKGAVITVSGNDRSDTLTGDGRGADGLYFTGGGHASRGGWAYDGDSDTASMLTEGGAYYGDLYNPTTRGSRGGRGLDVDGQYGEGAGTIYIRAGTSLFLDGIIRANGGDATGNHGGGSAGSAFIETGTLEGHGDCQAIGGSGGRGASGGRYAIYVQSEHHYYGTFTTHGGEGTSGTYLDDGGPGKIFLLPAVEKCGQSLDSSNLCQNLKLNKFENYLIIGINTNFIILLIKAYLAYFR